MMVWLLLPLLTSLCSSTVLGFTDEDMMRDAMLEKLGLSELPRLEKRDLESVVVSAHIRNKYLSMLKLHNTRRRRRAVPSLAGILRGIHGSADISGDVVYSDTTRQHLTFDMSSRIPGNSEVTMAELKLFRTPARHAPLQVQKRSARPVKNARVSIYWVHALKGGKNTTSLVDSRLVPIYESGWTSFDVTQAVQYWAKSRSGRQTPLHLQVWIEGERPGSHAAELAKSVRFATGDGDGDGDGDGVSSSGVKKPDLVLFTLDLDEFGSSGDCNSAKSSSSSGGGRSRCCREEHFINFRELSWTQYWIIEPVGYQAFRCAGGCKQPASGPAPGRSYGGGYGHQQLQRTCAAVESAPLPIMYLVKRGDHAEIEVAEFPNMIVEKCGCTTDNASV
ncbi:left-right determination factor 2-like [Engraulis encrasicolus]|uniref:left-right determination factor 2-like n=1 Tax=Engraulis encrasicolus TaxID=184585 RepID=UPI002FD50485